MLRNATIRKGSRVRITTTNGGEGTYILADDYRPTYDAILKREGGAAFVVNAGRLASIESVDSERDDRVMRVATYLAACGMSPLDRELWAAEHGRTFAAGGLNRFYRECSDKRAALRKAS